MKDSTERNIESLKVISSKIFQSIGSLALFFIATVLISSSYFITSSLFNSHLNSTQIAFTEKTFASILILSSILGLNFNSMILKINENEGQKAVLSFVRIQQCVLLILATLGVGICSDTNVVLFPAISLVFHNSILSYFSAIQKPILNLLYGLFIFMSKYVAYLASMKLNFVPLTNARIYSEYVGYFIIMIIILRKISKKDILVFNHVIKLYTKKVLPFSIYLFAFSFITNYPVAFLSEINQDIGLHFRIAFLIVIGYNAINQFFIVRIRSREDVKLLHANLILIILGAIVVYILSPYLLGFISSNTISYNLDIMLQLLFAYILVSILLMGVRNMYWNDEFRLLSFASIGSLLLVASTGYLFSSLEVYIICLMVLVLINLIYMSRYFGNSLWFLSLILIPGLWLVV